MKVNIILFSLLSIVLLACDSDDFTVNVQSDTQIFNNDGMELDIWYNSNYNRISPVVLFIHGGGWNMGNKSGWDRTFAEVFLSKNILSVSINYKLWPEARIDQQIKDIADAFNWVKANIGAYGGDSTNIYIMGHSAGAQLSAVYALNHQIKGAICIDGGEYMTELPQMMSDQTAYYRTVKTAFQNVLGNFDPKLYIPYYCITPDHKVPFLLLYQKDDNYRVIPNEKFGFKLSDNGNRVKLIPIDGLDHTEIYEKISDRKSDIAIEIIDFIST